MKEKNITVVPKTSTPTPPLFRRRGGGIQRGKIGFWQSRSMMHNYLIFKCIFCIKKIILDNNEKIFLTLKKKCSHENDRKTEDTQ